MTIYVKKLTKKYKPKNTIYYSRKTKLDNKNKNKDKNKSYLKKNDKHNNKNNDKKTKKINYIEQIAGAGNNEIYKSSRGTTMNYIFKEPSSLNIIKSAIFSTDYIRTDFKEKHIREYETITNIGFFNSKIKKKYRDIIKLSLKELDKCVYHINYVYFLQRKIRKIVYKLEVYIIKRIELIFNSTITQEDLLESNLKDSVKINPFVVNQLLKGGEKKSKITLKGGDPISITPEHLFLYSRSEGLVGPSNNDFDESPDPFILPSMKELFSKIPGAVSTFFASKFKSNYNKKGSYFRRELDLLFYKIAKLYKMLKKNIKPLVSSQHNLFMAYNRIKYYINVVIPKYLVSDNNEEVVTSLGKSKLKKFKEKKEFNPIFRIIIEYFNKLKSDYDEIIYMYESSLNGFWIQDEYGRILTNLYKKQNETFSDKDLNIIMNNINILGYSDQIADNIMGQLYVKISEKNINFTNPDQPKQTYFETRIIAQERFCFSRILVQYFVWNILIKSQGFNIDLDSIITNPQVPAITITSRPIDKNNKTSLIAKMLKTDSSMVYFNINSANTTFNYVGWREDTANAKDGLAGYMSFASLFGYYNINLYKIGIPPHIMLKRIAEAAKQKDINLVKSVSKTQKGGERDSLIDLIRSSSYPPNKLGPTSLTRSFIPPKIKSIRNIRYNTTTNRITNKIRLARQFEVKDGKKEKKGWVDIWINHFNNNFLVYSNLIDMYMNYDSMSKNGNEVSMQPDIYYRFYQDKIHKQFVKAFTSCGMLDILYRTFYTHIGYKINLKDDSDLTAFDFSKKLDYICMIAQMMYTYPLLVNRNRNIDLNDQLFQIRLESTANYINNIFEKYNNTSNTDEAIIIEKNLDQLISYIDNNKLAFINGNDDWINSIYYMLDISNNNPIDPANPSIITPQITPFDITNTDPNFATGIDQLIVIPLPAPPPVPTTAPTLTPTAPPPPTTSTTSTTPPPSSSSPIKSKSWVNRLFKR